MNNRITFGLAVPLLFAAALVLLFAVDLPSEILNGDADSLLQEQEVKPLKEVLYVQEAGRPRALFNAEGEEILRIEVLSDTAAGTRQRVVRDVASGEILYSVDLTGEADASSKLICLDAEGSVVRTGGEPLVVDDFDVYASISPGTVMNGTNNDVYGRVSERWRMVFPCMSEDGGDCQANTGSEACVFVWSVG